MKLRKFWAVEEGAVGGQSAMNSPRLMGKLVGRRVTLLKSMIITTI